MLVIVNPVGTSIGTGAASFAIGLPKLDFNSAAFGLNWTVLGVRPGGSGGMSSAAARMSVVSIGFSHGVSRAGLSASVLFQASWRTG